MTNYAPNYDVPENVSPFVPLPMLVRCEWCLAPTEPLALWVVVRNGTMISNLCGDCAND